VVIVCVLDYAASERLLRTPEVTESLKGKLLVQLSTGTPHQARQEAAWAQEAGVRYLDGAIMSYPDEIGTPEALLLFSGTQALFEAHREVFRSLGPAVFVGEESSQAVALDQAILSVFFGTMVGFVQGAAMCDAEGILQQTFAAALEQWIGGVVQGFKRGAERIATRQYGDTTATVEIGAITLDMMSQVAAENGLDRKFPEFLASYYKKAMAAGYGQDDLTAVFEVLRGQGPADTKG
jgi:3-hydroxyisobutyrate dehydrogenase-like beta-hydroxyacid dehydrogenase